MERENRRPSDGGKITGENSKIPNVSGRKDNPEGRPSLWPDIEEMRKTGRVPRNIQYFKADAF